MQKLIMRSKSNLDDLISSQQSVSEWNEEGRPHTGPGSMNSGNPFRSSASSKNLDTKVNLNLEVNQIKEEYSLEQRDTEGTPASGMNQLGAMLNDNLLKGALDSDRSREMRRKGQSSQRGSNRGSHANDDEMLVGASSREIDVKFVDSQLEHIDLLSDVKSDKLGSNFLEAASNSEFGNT